MYFCGLLLFGELKQDAAIWVLVLDTQQQGDNGIPLVVLNLIFAIIFISYTLIKFSDAKILPFFKMCKYFMPTFSHLFPKYTLFNNHTKMNIHTKNIQNVRKPNLSSRFHNFT